MSVLERLSPRAADVWMRALRPVGESVSTGSLSLDPGGSSVEATKWLAYAATFALGADVARRRGASWGIGLVFVSALAVAGATLVHGLVGATNVFGVYEPSFSAARWHIGPLLNPNNLAGYLNLGVFLGLGKAVSSGTRARWFWALGAAFLTACSFLSGSRGGALCLVVGMGAFAVGLALGRARRRMRAVDWSALGLAFGVSTLFGWLGASDQTWAELLEDSMGKLGVSRTALPMLRDYTWFGVGRGSFASAFSYYTLVENNTVQTLPENWVLQWLSEWGLVVGGVGILGLAWLFKPARFGVSGNATRLSVFLAVVVWLLQNLADHGSELLAPSLAVALLLGSCWSQGRGAVDEGGGSEEELARTAHWQGGWGVVGAALLGLSTVFAWARGVQNVAEDRARLGAEYLVVLEGGGSAEGTSLFEALRVAMLRHPAEPYFSRLGALLAFNVPGHDPMPWVQRSLELCLANGRTHWILAHVLWRRNARDQALLEARLAVEYEPDLARSVGATVASWTQVVAELERAAPLGRAGAILLQSASEALSARLPAESDQLLRLAIDRDEKYVPPRRALAAGLLRRVRSSPADSAPLVEEIERHLPVLERIEPASAYAIGVTAELGMLKGQTHAVKARVRKRCAELKDLERVRCFQALLGLYANGAQRQELMEIARELRAFGLGPQREHQSLYEALGDAFGNAELWGNAVDAYQESLQDEPRFNALMKLARAAIQAGRFSVANRALERAHSMAIGEQRARVASQRDILLRSMLK